MKVKEIYVEAKVSKNFNSYTVGATVELEKEEDKLNPDECIRLLQKRCRDLAREQFKEDIPRG